MAQVYVWGKYNLNVKYEEDHSAHAPKQGDINNFWVGKSYSFSAVRGKYTLNNALEMSRENDAAQYPYAIDGAMAGDGVYYAEEAYGINKTAGWISSSGKLAYRIPDTLSGKIFYPVYYGAKTIKEKGVYIEDVTSESENTYPKDGISGSYYYVFKYAVPGVPSITVPGAAMIGHAVDISWEAADSAESYKLERRVDSGGWTQVYAGDDLTYTDTVQSGWTSVQYRISAGISGVYGGLTVSNVVSIIPVSSLVISGTDGNLGTAKAPVTYSVTSDTDSPITVTEIINGHERTLTPTSGQLITIPVSMLDPGAGAITIKASVQAASGAVNQTRNWTYTKTPLALPVDPYRVERMQGKECDIFPQTLAEAVFMPDGSSVAGPVIGRNVIRSYPVASGQSIQAGDVVDVVEGKAQKTLTPVANVETVLLERAVTHMAVCDLNSEYAVVANSKDNGFNHAAFLISKKTGKRVGDNNYANETTITGLSIARLSDTQFLIGYVENRALYVKLGTVSGNSISFSQSESVDTAFYNLFALAELTNGRVAVVYSALIAGSNKLRMRVFTLSSSSLGSIYTRDITGESSGEISATSMNDGRVCICYVDLNDGNKGKVLIAAVDSSNAVTWGDVAVFNDTYTAKPRCASNQKGNVVISYYSSSPVGVAARTCIVSGNTIIPRFAPLQITSTSGVIENTIAQIPGACVVSCENGNAYLLLNEGSELSLAATYKFLHSSGTSKSLDITAIANKQVLLCYSAAGNSGYGTSTILTASGNQIAGSFINGSQDAIALKSGTAGQSIEVIYSGTVAADWVTEGQVITSHGVYGAGVLAGVLQVWSKYMPRGHKMVTGIFIGRQASTSDLTNNIELGFRPQYIVVLSEASPNTRRIALPGLTYRWNANDISSNDGLTITDTGFLIANNTTNNNEKYHYVAFG
ncbi:hypothetical protein LIR37_17125 [Flavonifractor plautii]|uniref:hypothetical protein n=2 Tax=Flavonifractor plautii TaxID=292800 RepID=UPI001D00E0B5|nr:hypothetical protein [Flavonifractor plautii]MCB5856078.1 hypothetical protein [Flavonifractor plautii]